MNHFNEIEAGIQSLFAATNAGYMNDPAAGQDHIGTWLNELRSSNDPALRPIAQELETLNQTISKGDLPAMAKSFFQLGHLTGAAALNLHSFAGIGDKLRELSQKLISAGGNIQIIAQQRGLIHAAPAHH
jgi:hypothetical protein